MFKIARARTEPAIFSAADGEEMNQADAGLLSQFCVTEGWIGDLANGLIRMGEKSSSMHGLSSPECGLLSLMRCYEPRDRASILELFEQASSIACHFCFSTTVILSGGRHQPVFCTGESTGLEQPYTGSILGVFLFPRFRIEAAPKIYARQ